ncbi:MAG: DNA repair exonuclease [Thermomicrobiales bacterium]|nr:DNA repair exonuclease [Thermomicrobiales bacterium]
MNPLRIAHISDTHLGYRALGKTDPLTGRNQRSIDVENAFADAVTDILKRDVDLVVHSGDLFNQTRPAYASIGSAMRQFRRLEERGIPSVVIGGNHDTPRLRSSGSVFSLMHLVNPTIRFVGGYETEIVPFPELDLTVTAVPHGRLTEPIPPAAFPNPETRNILITHGFVPGMTQVGHREPGEEEIDETLLPADFDYIALGHFHIRGEVRPNAWYAGSTERFGFADEPVVPGYLIVELGERGTPPVVETVKTHARPMLRWRIDEEETNEKDAIQIAGLILEWLREENKPDAMAMAVVFGVPRAIRRQVEQILREEAAELVWTIQVRGASDVLAGLGRERVDLPAIDLEQLFNRFLETERTNGNHDPAFSARVGEIGRAELRKAQAALAAELANEGS